MQKILRRDLYYADLDPVIASEQAGYRPVVILQNDTGNRFSNTVIVAAITSKPDAKAKLPTHCYIKAGEVLDVPSVVLLEQLRTLDKSRLSRYIGRLSQAYMEKIDRALVVSLGLPKAISTRSDFLFLRADFQTQIGKVYLMIFVDWRIVMFEEKIAQMNRKTAAIQPDYAQDKRTYTVNKIQDILGISRPTAYTLVKRNLFRSIRIGGQIRISKKSFNEWLDNGGI